MPTTKKPAQTGPKWKAEQRAQLAGARRPSLLDPPPPALTRDEGWALVCEHEKAMAKESGAIDFRNAQAKAFHQPIQASYKAKAAGLLDPQHEKLRHELLRWFRVGERLEEGLAAFWVGSGGFALVMEVMRAPCIWQLGSSGTKRNMEIVPRDPKDTSWGQGDNDNLWRAIRRRFFALPEIDFAAARDAAVAWAKAEKKSLTPTERIRVEVELGYAFARDPSLSHRAAEHLLRDKKAAEQLSSHAHKNGFGRLLTSITDVDLARRFTSKFDYLLDHLNEHALDVVESLERDAAEVLGTLIAVNNAATGTQRDRTYWNKPLKAAQKLALTDPRPPTP